MMTYQHIEECLSRAYVMAVAAHAGVNVGTSYHDYGVDGTFSKVQIRQGRRFETGVKIDYQLKATKNWRLEGEEVVYALEAKTYNDLILRNSERRTTPLILILLCLPREDTQWMEQSEEQLVVRRCCYWTSPVGHPTANSNSVTIRISRRQLFTPISLTSMLDKIEKDFNII